MSSEDYVQVKVALKDVERNIKELKKEMRASGHNIQSYEYFSLRSWKDEATKYCTILAESHGRVHKSGGDPKEQKAAVEAWGIIFQATGS